MMKRHIATFFIDGADLLAKKEPETFTDLVDVAKHLANNHSLQIIFVSSSEGHVLLLEETSSRSRKAPVIEISDISDEKLLTNRPVAGGGVRFSPYFIPARQRELGSIAGPQVGKHGWLSSREHRVPTSL